MPNTTMLAVIAGAAMAGVPLLNGFLSKEMFFAETLAARRGLLMDVLPVGLAIAASAFGVVSSLRFVRGGFFGPVSKRLPRQPPDPPLWMRIPIWMLALACLDRKSGLLGKRVSVRVDFGGRLITTQQ